MNPRTIVRRIVLAVALTGCLATAAFALSTTAHAAQEGCCLVIAQCMPESQCSEDPQCGEYGYCCLQCGG